MGIEKPSLPDWDAAKTGDDFKRILYEEMIRNRTMEGQRKDILHRVDLVLASPRLIDLHFKEQKGRKFYEALKRISSNG